MSRVLRKTISWACIATCLSICTSYFVFGTLVGSVQLTVVDACVFPVLYYLHECVWSRRKK